MNGTRIIFPFPVSKLVNVSYRGRRVISKAESLGCTLDCGFKIPRRQAATMELVCGSWESINSPYRKTLRVQYAEKSTRREFARNYDPFSLSSSSQFRTPTYFYLPLPLSLSFYTPFFHLSSYYQSPCSSYWILLLSFYVLDLSSTTGPSFSTLFSPSPF